jgi:hypothetical protein
MKKKRKYFLWGILGPIAAFIIVSNILSNYFGYDEVKRGGIIKTPLLNDSICAKTRIKKLYSNRLGDSIYILKYKEKYQLVLWAIHQSTNLAFSNQIDTNQVFQWEPEQVTYYCTVNLLNKEHAYFDSKAFLPSKQNISIHFNGCSNIQLLRKSDKYQYYHLKAGNIYLINEPNKYYDCNFGLAYGTDADFMAITLNNTLYLLALYSLDSGENIDSEELFRIMNIRPN